ncbi:3-oxoacyl-[acyl-carrier-protein] reductase FabG-like [Watersipora subatra]|uniref:3-oxoacyl-[acyl-carrier-protein] reductase FabG-like n=1 Tax=Watersipora subatra TaxID=2589382 RepID=UPI00355B78C3
MSMDWNTGRRFPKLNVEETKGRFKDYVVLVTGGCSGIGKAAVERFASDGATVYALDIRVQAEEDFMKAFGKRVKCIQLDVTDGEKCKEVAADIASRHNIIHTLVNNAAYFGSKGITATRDDWIKSFDVNVIGYSNMTQAVVPYMKNGADCSIVNMSSISGLRAQPMRWTYSATKGGICSMTKCMALDLRENGIRVNCVSPSWAWSPEVAKAANYDREKSEETWQRFFINGRLAEVEEVAAVIVFLASRDASYITGSDIPVCGGYLAIGPEQRGENSSFAGTEY